MSVQELSQGGPDGVRLGQSATDKVGLFGKTPVAQPTGAAQAAITDNSGGAASPTTGVVATACQQSILIPLQLADIATGTFKVAVPFAFQVTAALFRTAKPATTAAKAATLTVGISGTPVTGGVIALTSANQNTIGGSVAASAITAANTGTAGQTLEVTASSVTAFVEGDGWVELTVIDKDLANAFATVIAQGNAVQAGLVTVGALKGAA